MSVFKAKPPAWIDPIGVSSGGASVYNLIREDIIEGRLGANERLVAADLARRSRPDSGPAVASAGTWKRSATPPPD